MGLLQVETYGTEMWSLDIGLIHKLKFDKRAMGRANRFLMIES